MDFVRSYFDTNKPLISADLEKKWGQKGLTGQRFICIEVTSHKIHNSVSKRLLPLYNGVWDISINYNKKVFLAFKKEIFQESLKMDCWQLGM